MRIRRRKCRKRYLGSKRVYVNERFFMDFPARFRDVVEPFYGQDLDVEIRKEGDYGLVIVLTARENVSGARKTPAKI